MILRGEFLVSRVSLGSTLAGGVSSFNWRTGGRRRLREKIKQCGAFV